ncbi:hypothetical protein HMF3257_32305 [Spirosoma telluris]|uniref:Response regulatory domain-containing protein n=2 Tax=Spirosoma telluris TaxID=2183553 RepID=A0A327NSV2_9BACT|nr:hypothetical protein HMF3257_32305 [Spirosoma telluris]
MDTNNLLLLYNYLALPEPAMSTIRTVIVEDIPAELAWTKNQLSIHCPDVELVGETGHLEEATRLIKATRPDLLLMDIEIRAALVMTYSTD